MQPILSILMPALSTRAQPMRACIEAQIAGRDDVEFLVDEDAGEATSGVKRQRLTDRARGEWVAFVDDDDGAAPDYVVSILRGIESGADVVTFDLELTRADRPGAERWCFGLQPDDRAHGKMGANHLCAWRAKIARKIGWCPDLGGCEDQLWYKPLVASKLARTEHHIERVLYHYRYDPAVTVNQRADMQAKARAYFGKGMRWWLNPLGGGLWVECGSRSGTVRNELGERFAIGNAYCFGKHEGDGIVTLS